MRVGVVVLILLSSGSGAAVAGDRGERAYVRQQQRVEAYYGPQVALPGVTDQVVVDRGPRILVEQDSLFGLFQPVFAPRRLPSRVRRVHVDADGPWAGPPVEAREVRRSRRAATRP